MRKLAWGLPALVAAGLAGATWVVRQSEPPALILPATRAPAEIAPADLPASPARPAEEPDAERLAAALKLLGDAGRRERCGPYPLYTDVADPRLLAACGRLATALDGVYEERYGVRPEGEPAEAIFLFSRIAAYRAFARGDGVPMGYAGYAVGGRGFAAFHLGTPGGGDRPLADFLSTLTHELTHLVIRRSLGPNLPPWLSEGLADGIGDTAAEEGLRPLEAAAGSGAQARRLRRAYRDGRAGGLERLVGLKRGEFDRGAISFDYEQSALFVRFLLAEPGLAPGFRSFLAALAAGEPHAAELLSRHLALSWPELDRRFEAWLGATS
jgi:hypothetical protein